MSVFGASGAAPRSRSGSGSRAPRKRRSRLLTLPQLLAAAVELNPSAQALVFEGQSLTYAELDEASSRLARILISRGIGPESFVALGLSRSIWSVLATWAVAKTGGAFVPIDPNYPADRTEHMVSDSGAVLGIATADTADRLPATIEWLHLDSQAIQDEMAAVSGGPVSYADRLGTVRVENTAYVIYTSGSTGRPKGVVVTHGGLSNLAAEQRERFKITPESRTAHFASPSFDASMLELLLAIGAGATMVVVPPSIYGGTELSELLRRERVTHMFITPAALASMDPTGMDQLRSIAVGGEAFTLDLVAKWAEGRDFFNVYGPTETTILATGSNPLSPAGPLPLGEPLRGVSAYVLDSRLNAVPVGVTGELYLSGPGVARGYHDRWMLTSDRFVANPFGDPGARMYRTGDLVRRIAHGDDVELEYIGRSDFQVKVRGFRIELGEIDAALTEHDAVDFAVTVGHSTEPGNTSLVAYVRPVAGATIAVDELKEFVGQLLPSHMVPAAVLVIDEIPLTQNGKLDRNALPEPVFEAKVYRAPATPVEEIVAGIYAAVLDLDRVGADDDFFELGGNSLLGTQVMSRLGVALNAQIPVRDLFEASTVRALATRAESHAGTGARAPLERRPRPERIPLSLAQSRMWFLNRFDTESAVNNIPVAIRLSGPLDIDALQAAVGDIVLRHEPLRTLYPDHEGTGHQVILPAAQAIPNLTPTSVTAADLPGRIAKTISVGFDVTNEVPVRIKLFRLSDTEHVLVVVIHHISADGSSMAPLTRDVMLAYAARSASATPDWTSLPVQYADFSIWQREILGSEDDPDAVISRQLAFWQKTLADLPDELALPTDRPRPQVAANHGHTYAFSIDADRTARLEALARDLNSTLFMVMHGALNVLLSRLSNSADIVVGTPVAGRGEQALDDVVGMFVNTLVLRTEVRPASSFAQLVEQVREVDLSAFANADVPFERLVEVLSPARSQSRHPLFQVALFFQNIERAELELAGLKVAPVDFDAELARFDLQLTLSDSIGVDGSPTGLDASFNYATALFDESTIVGFAERYLRIIDTVLDNPAGALGDIAILGAAERHAALHEWNATDHPVSDEFLLSGFDAQVARTPDRTAVVYEGTSLTYAEFDERVNRLARYLIGKGVGAETLVALAMRRSLDLVVGMYAVLRAGGGYVPVDPDHPASRTEYILDAANPVCVLTTDRDAVRLDARHTAVYLDLLDLSDISGSTVRVEERLSRLLPEHPAYVIFTSGSTGKPKGVAVSHRAIANQMAWMQHEYRLDQDDVYLQKTATTFDVSLWGFFLPLRVGAGLVVATPDGHRDVGYVTSSIKKHGVTVTDFVPSMLAVFVSYADPADLVSLRSVFVIGEALPASSAHGFAGISNAALHNLYGPTEAAVSITYRQAQLADEVAVPIGLPQWNSRVYVLDSRLQPVPAGVSGELYLGGVQLARGYHGRVDLTSDRFVASPFGAPGQRIYRTGDLVRWVQNPDGTAELVYIGRTDFQVKFRGQRIELGEIETVLLSDPAVMSASVQVASLPTGDQLVGYLVPAAGAEIDVDEVRGAAGKALPSYMMPSAFIVLDEFPLNASGKLDRKALPEPVFEGRAFRAPTTPVEEIVAEGYAAALDVERVGLDDDFFALGGNSLIAMQVIARIGAALDSRIPVRDLFEAPTVEALAARIESQTATARLPLVAQSRPQRVPLSLAQSRMWFLNQFEPDSPAYNLPFAIRLTGVLDDTALAAAVADVVARHEVLRTVYPEAAGGPVQVIIPAAHAIPDLSAEPVDEADIESAVGQFVSASFDVTAEIPVRAKLFRLSERVHVLAVVVHHVSGDGSSAGPLTRDLMTAYFARSRGEEPQWTPLAVQYADYALWQRAVLGSEDDPSSLVSQQLAYWSTALAGIPDLLELPTDRRRPAVQSYAGDRVDVRIDPGLHRRLVELAHAHNSTLFMVVHAAFAALLSRLSASDDVTVGTPIAGRGEQVLDDLIGMFVNTLVLRAQVEPGMSFAVLLSQVRETDLQAFAHADVPFERLVEVLNPERSQARHPLFQVGFSFQNLATAALELPGLAISALETDGRTSQFDLHLIVQDSYDDDGTPAGIAGVLTYVNALFDEATVQSFVDRLLRLLHAVVDDPSVAVGDVELLAAPERTMMLDAWNATTHATDLDATLVSLFDDRVSAAPDAPALVFGGTTLTYAEFDARVNRLARHLISQQVGPETLVALAIRRSIDLLVAMFAVSKAGGGYVPIDPDAPTERIAYVLDTAAPVLVLSTAQDAFAGVDGVPVVNVDEIDVAGLDSSPIDDGERRSPLTPDHVAYVIFTSGSTGRPKGVAVSHAAVANQLQWQRDEFELGGDDVAILKTAATFDLSVWEFWSALTSGGRLVITEPEGHRDPEYLLGLLRTERVTTLHTVPSMLSMLLTTAGGELTPSLRRVLAIGEALPGALAVAFRLDNPAARLFNLYGPTEAAVSITAHEVAAGDRAGVPIGAPEWNSRVYVLDGRLKPVSVGVAGELYLAGTQLARGYQRRSDLTAERFVADPFGPTGARLYRTGDLVRWNAGGELEYVGRTDFQVKVRGFRIELGEIETVLRRQSNVADAVVLARTSGAAGEHLVGYLVPTSAGTLDTDALADVLAAELPDYMIPAYWVVLEELPLNPNGKLDRGRLPAPVIAPKLFRQPNTPMEIAIAELIGDVLGQEQVGLDDSFFALGGDSIVSIQLVSRAKARGIVFGPRDVFEQKTVMGLASVAEFATTAPVLAELPGGGVGAMPLPTGAWPFIIDGTVDRAAQVLAVRLPTDIHRDGLVAVLGAAIDRHDALRTRVLQDAAGWAFEVAPAGTVPVESVLRQVECNGLDDAARHALIEAEAARAVADLDPANGRVAEFVWLDTSGAGRDLLLVALHRLVADSRSASILLSDMSNAWIQLLTGEEPAFPAPTTSMRRWAHAVADAAQTDAYVGDFDTWRDVLPGSDAGLLSAGSDGAATDDDVDRIRTVEVPLPADVTSALLNEVPRLYHADPVDGVLAGLALALARHGEARHGEAMGVPVVRVEGDLRAATVVAGADLSRTMGPFTASFPMRLHLNGIDVADALAGGRSAGRALKQVKEQRRTVPTNGVGYAVLRHLNPETASRFGALPEPQVSFAYRDGNWGTAGVREHLGPLGWQMSSEVIDLSVDADRGAPAPVNATARVNTAAAVPVLTLSVSFAPHEISEAAVTELAELWSAALVALSRHAHTPGAGGLTPSDLALVDLSQQEIEGIEARYPSVSDIWPLSPLQSGMLFHATFAAQTIDVYTMQLVLDLSGDIDTARLRTAAQLLLDRHPNLRTAFVTSTEGDALQVVLDDVEVPWAEIDLTGVDADGLDRAVAQVREDDYHNSFDPATAPLIRFAVIRTAARDGAGAATSKLLMTNHHILLDGWSTPLVLQELLVLYTTQGNVAALPPAPSYRDFLAWLDAQDPGAAREVWNRSLRGAERTQLARGERGHDVVDFSARHTLELSLQQTKALSDLATRLGVTLNTVTQAAWGLLLARTIGRDDVVFGATVSGRPAQLDRVETMVGLFINTVPVRLRIDPEESLTELLTRLQREQSELLDHHYLSLTEIQAAAGVGELFDTITVFESFPVDEEGIAREASAVDELSVTGINSDANTHFALALRVHVAEKIAAIFTYRTDLLDEVEVMSLADRFVKILDAATTAPAQRVGDISILGKAERSRLLFDWNDTDRVVDIDASLPSLFDAQVRRTPEAVALVDDRGARLTYADFDARTNRLARHLIAHGVGPESMVGLAIRRSIETLIGMYATVKAGGAYVPIDPDQPVERTEYVLGVARPACVLTSSADGFDVGVDVPVFEIDRIDTANYSDTTVTDADRLAPLRPDNTAYAIFTSGSTGKPKGVAVSHAAAVNHAHWRQHNNPLGADDTMLQKTPFTFDASVREFWWPLLVGARLAVATPDGHKDPSYLVDKIAEHRITAMHFVPSMLAAFVPAARREEIASLRLVMCGGESLPADLVSDFIAISDAELRNEYGPTEGTVVSTRSAPLVSEPTVVPIGRPVPNTRVFVLDARLQPAPIGAAGELYLAGAQLARGYVGRSDLTAERFVANPFSSSERLYRTGDLVRWLSDGVLEFIGRTDFQVKLRGLRIELGEIEAVLRGHDSVARSVVVLRNDERLGAQLVGYVVPVAGATVDVAQLTDMAAGALPDYMVPGAIVVLDEFPLNTSGKLDRKALPAPVFESGEFRAPTTPVEEIVAGTFAELLGLDRVGLDDDFFELGGNSLIAMQALARLGRALDTRLPIKVMFEASKVGALAARLESVGKTGGRPPLVPQQRPDHIPLSLAQQRMWFLSRFDTETSVNNIPMALRLSGSLNVEALQAAVNDVMARHEILRTVYPDVDGVGYQAVLSATESSLDLTPEPVAEAELVHRASEFMALGFDVTAAVPLRAKLFEIAARDHVLVVVVHHISCDGFSVGPLARDVMVAYAARSQQERPEWTPLPVQYADFAIWQRQLLGSEANAKSLISQQISYWQRTLQGLPDQLELPSDRPRPAVASNRGGRHLFALDAALQARIDDFSKAHGATSFMLVHAALAVLLARLSGTSDIAIGTPVAGRGESALDDVIGMFVNTLVLRSDVAADIGFADLLTRTKEADLAAFAHADVPFERLVEVLNPARSQARHPLFQVMLAFQNLGPAQFELPGLTLSAVEAHNAVAKFDLQLTMSEVFDANGARAGLNGEFTFATDLFDETTIVRFTQQFETLLRALLDRPDEPVGDLELLDPAERERILVGYNATDRVVDTEATLVSMFHDAVERWPDAPAVKFDGVPAQALAYREFGARVNQLARHLIANGVGPDVRVALAMRRSLDLVVAMYAVSVAGGAYVPLDPDQPTERIAHIVNTAAPLAVLTTSRDGFDAPADVPVWRVDAIELSGYSSAVVTDADRSGALLSQHTAYVIFTSGSTGRPKGVAVSHGAIVNRLVWMQQTYGLDSSDVVLQKTPATFDVSVWEFFWPLQVGAELVVAQPDGHRDPAYLVRAITDHHVTTLHFVPSMLSVFVAAAGAGECGSLRRVFASGEALPADTAQRLRALTGARLHNLYGPTEAAVDVTFHEVVDSDLTSVPIGAPVFNTQVYVLDARLHPVPTGVAGELYLAGQQLARGYDGRPDLSADRFVANPFEPGQRMYRTGDLVRWRRSGELDYLGRTDFQVKLRGQRIELGEIEAALSAREDVAAAVVVMHSDARTGDQLVAYLVATGGATLDVDIVRAALVSQLPSYMVPAAYVVLDELPLNPSGKLDRKLLPAPQVQERVFRAPTNPVEEVVAGTFADLLGRERVGLDDDFFALGGNSLVATQVAARLSSALDTTVSVRSLFEATTVAGLAALVGRHAGSGGRAALVPQPRPERIPLSLAQTRMWFLNRFDTTTAVNNVPAAIRLSGALDVEALQAAVNDVIARHEILRTLYPEIDGAGTQVVLPAEQARVELLPEDVREAEVMDRVVEVISGGFDVTDAVPVRATLLRVAPTEFVLVVVVHHISTDGFSMGPLTRDVMLAYAARVQGDAPAWTELPVQYADYTLWQRAVLGAEDDPESLIAQQVSFWVRELDGLPDQLELPIDRSRPAIASNRGATYTFTVDAGLHGSIDELARGHSATPFMVVHAALAVLLARISGTADIAIGTPIAGRGEAALDDLVGMFVNTLVLRTKVDSARTFAEVLDGVREADLRAFANADLPFERLVEVLNPARSQGRHPLFQVALFFQNMQRAELRLGELTAEALEADARTAKFDLQFAITESFDESGRPAGLFASINYATDLFDEDSVATIADRFVRVLSGVTAEPAHSVGSVDVLGPVERTEILRDWNDTDSAVADRLLLDGFTAQQARTPYAVALVYEGESLTYAELDSRVNRLARILIDIGVGPGSLVAIGMRRSLDLVTGMYAVLAAGGGYVPVDPDHPADRIRYILDAASPIAVLSNSGDDFDVPAPHRVLHVDTLDSAGKSPAPIADVERLAALRPEDVAYVIFTSGSTGRPKGVAVSHRAIVNQMAWMQATYGLTAQDVYLQKTATTFDVSLWGYFLPLRVGATLVVATPDGHRDPGYLAGKIGEYGVTVTDFVPSMLSVFAGAIDPAVMQTVRQVFVIGEALPAETVRDFRRISSARVHNLYGPTEAAVSITYCDVTETPAGGAVSIGVPQWNSRVYVLDGRLQPVPPGVPGELYLAGVQLARGYHGRVDLTADRFVADPFGTGRRMYRTGDLVRWDTAGNLDYIGRTDFQVKFRGQRIELGEIETALQAHVAVLAAAARVVPTSAGDQLVGYVVSTSGTEVDPHALREFLAERLPGYMVPAAIVVLDEFPLNASGKLDRKALPTPEFESSDYRAPATPIEEVVARTVADVLGLLRVGADDDFFALGGNSLAAMQVAARLSAALDSRVAVRTLFESPTVESLAARVESQVASGGRVPLEPQMRPASIPLSLAQSRMWFLNRFEPASAAYNIPIVLRLEGALDTAALTEAVNDVVARHEVLRTVYPDASGEGVQVVLPASRATIDLSVESVTEAEAADRLITLVGTGFDVVAEVPLRAALYQFDQESFLFAIVIHHISADGFSMGPLTRDVITAYAARVGGDAPSWAPLPVQYADYALWQRATLGDEGDPTSLLSRQVAHWREVLAGIPDQLDLPSDRPRPPIASQRGATYSFAVGAELHDRVGRLAREHSSTSFMITHAVLAALLSRLSGTTDIAIGTPVAGRGEAALDDLVGMFVNTLVLRTDASLSDSFVDLLAHVRRVDLSAFSHADVPFERVVEAMEIERSTARTPLFQVALAFQPAISGPSLELAGIKLREFDFDPGVSRFDLQVTVAEQFESSGAPAGMSVALTYATDLFDEPTIASFGTRFERLLDAATANPSGVIGDFDLRSEHEVEHFTSRHGAIGGRERVTLPELLALVAQEHPDRVAVTFEGQELSYRELDAQSSRLARELIARGAGPEGFVALGIPRSIESVLAVWAVAKTGAAFVPVDPNYPADRIARMVQDSGSRLGVTVSGNRESLPQTVEWLVLDEPTFASVCAERQSTPVQPSELLGKPAAANVAYVIYTSGSTGLPKGVSVTHGGLANLAAEQRDRFVISRQSRTLHFASPSFDAAMLELLLAIATGATMVIVPPSIYGGEQLAELMRRERVTHAFITPAALASIDPSGLPDLESLAVGGEAYSRDLVARWSVGRRFFNVYGPTETTILATSSDPLDGEGAMPIGVPLRGVSATILDSRLHPVPAGVPGDLYLSGPGLARGYHDRRGLTSDRFVAGPYGVPGERMYRTGDVVSWTSAGEMTYVGRSDSQVKVRGFRIELGEIDAVLARHEAVNFVTTQVHEGSGGTGASLVAYVLPTSGRQVDAAELKEFAGRSLPGHMVPPTFVALDTVPLTPVGKLDRRALPSPEIALREFRAPETPIELAVAAVFAEVLGIERVGLDDDFFELGGHSLLVLRVVNRLRELVGAQLTVQELFDHSSVVALAKVIDPQQEDSEVAGFADHVQLAADITAVGAEPAVPVASQILLTGATGFLGSHLVRELLDQTEARVWCLVRADSPEQALHRVEESMRRFGSWQDGDDARIVAVCGDLGEERLGLDKAEFDNLATRIDAIVHNGARVNHIETYLRLHKPNVVATEWLLRLASTHRLKPLHFVSTGSVLTDPAARAEGQEHIVREDDWLPADKVMDSGYAQSKWVGESIVRIAAERGVPVSIYRPALITGDVETGACGTDDAFWNMVRAIVALGQLPEIADGTVPMVPVNYVARALVRIAINPENWGGTFHLVNRTRAAMVVLADRIRDRGFVLRDVTVEEFAMSLFTAAESLSARGDESLMRAMLVAGQFASGMAEAEFFDDAHTAAALAGTGIEPPVVGAETLGRYVDFYTRTGFFSALDDEEQS